LHHKEDIDALIEELKIIAFHLCIHPLNIRTLDDDIHENWLSDQAFIILKKIANRTNG